MPQIHVRIPPDLHQHLVKLAAEQDISLNTLVLILLAGASGFKLQ
jgi:predicted HicB family RNase H-like nuclease